MSGSAEATRQAASAQWTGYEALHARTRSWNVYTTHAAARGQDARTRTHARAHVRASPFKAASLPLRVAFRFTRPISFFPSRDP
eukprot:4666492-Pleurochrysis_carterae.AAC.2